MSTKKKVLAIISVLLIIAIVVTIVLIAKPNEGQNSPTDGAEPVVKEPVNVEDWVDKNGEWVIEDDEISIKEDKEDSVVVFNKEVDQYRTTISVDVKFDTDEAIAGIIFRNSEFADKYQFTDFSIDIGQQETVVHNQQSYFNAKYTRENNFEQGVWYTMKVELNGHNGKFYINDILVDERSDFMVEDGQNKIALTTDSKDVKFRNLKVEEITSWDRDWASIIAQSKIEKHGSDRYEFSKYEYCYTGLAGTTMLVGPYGFTAPDAPKEQIGVVTNNHRFEGMLIYEYWWKGTDKETPFQLTGGYYVDGELDAGSISGENFDQVLDIANGLVTTDLVLDVNGTSVESHRETFVDENGVAHFTVQDTNYNEFVLQITPAESEYLLTFSEKDGCLVVTADLGEGDLAVIAIASNGTVDAKKGAIVFDTSSNTAEMYVAPASTLNEKDAVEQAIARANDAKKDGVAKNLTSVSEWWNEYYSQSSIDIPDLGMAQWYARTLFYNAVAIAESDVPPGCYATNPEGFFGDVCFEFDIMYSYLGLLAANRTEVTQEIADWLYEVQPYLQELASNDYYGYPEGSVKYAWLMGYDGTPVQSPSLEQGWRNDYPNSNVAYALLMQSLYTGENLEAATDVLWRETLAEVSAQIWFDTYDGYAHRGVWGPTAEDFNNISTGDFLQNVGLIWSIRTAQEYGVSRDEWDAMLPDILLPQVYDSTLGAHVYVNATLVGEYSNPKGSGGPQFMPYFWLGILDADDETFKPTFINVEANGNLNYNFNKGWASSVASKNHLSDLALEMARLLLDPATCLYDDNTMVECVTDDEDYERAPHLGAMGSYLMAVNDMLFDGYDDETITVFPAITDDWQEMGVSFTNMLANGQIEVSADYSTAKTVVSLKNESDASVTREILIRVPAGSTDAEVIGASFNGIKEGCFVSVTVTIGAGETVEISVVGKQGSDKPGSFAMQFPYDNADGVASENVAFGWEQSNGAESYKLIVSASKDLSNPVVEMDLGDTTFIRKGINLNRGTTYYWKVVAINANGSTDMDGGVKSFTTEGGTLNVFGIEWERVGSVSVVDGKLQINITSGSNDTANMILTTADSNDYEVTIKLNLLPQENYQQAGIILYQDDSTYVKIARMYTSDLGIPAYEFGGPAIQSYVTSVPDTDPTNPITYMKLKKVGTEFAAYVSSDGVNYVQIGGIAEGFLQNAKIGVFASSWTDATGAAVIEDVKIEYTSEAIDTDAMMLNIFGHLFTKTGSVSVENGKIKIDIPQNANDTNNKALLTQKLDDFDVKIKVNQMPTEDYQQSGLIIYVDDNHYIKLSRIYNSAIGRGYEFGGTLLDDRGAGCNDITDNASTWLRLVKVGQKLAAYISADGKSWTQLGDTVDVNLSVFSLGVFGATWKNVSSVAYVEDFVLETENVTFDTAATTINAFGHVFSKSGVVDKVGEAVKIKASGNDTTNKIVFGTNKESFDIITKIKFKPTQDHLQSGIIVMLDSEHYIKVARAYSNGLAQFQLQGQNGTLSSNAFVSDNIAASEVYLRLVKVADRVGGFYSADGLNWVPIGEICTTPLSGELQIGMYASSWTTAVDYATVSEFYINYKNVVFDENLYKLNALSQLWDKKGSVSLVGGNIQILTGANDTANMVSFVPDSQDFDIQTTLDFTSTGENIQAGIILYQDDLNYIKLVRDTSSGMKLIRFYGQPGNMSSDASLSDKFESDIIHLRIISKDGKIAAYYSADGSEWKIIGSVFDCNITINRVGLYASSWSTEQVPAEFTAFSKSYDNVKFLVFENNAVFGRVWEYRGDAENKKSSITMTTGGNDTTNMALTDIPEGDFEVLLKLKFAPTVENQQAGIILYQDNDTYVKFVRGYLWNSNRFNVQHSSVNGNKETVDKIASDTCFLKLRIEGTTLTLWYGASEGNLMRMGTFNVPASFNPTQVGVFAASWGAAEIPAEVLDFRIDEVTTEKPGEDPGDKPVDNTNSIFGYDWVFNGNSVKDTDKISMTTGANDTTNMALTDIPEGDFEVLLKLKFAPGVENQQAGIILYQDDDTYVKFVRGYLWNTSRFNVQHSNVNGNKETVDKIASDTCFLKLRKEGTTLTLWYGASEENLIRMGTFEVPASFNPTQVGAFAASWGAAEIPAEVLDFRIDEVTTEKPGEDPGDKPVDNTNSIFGYDWVFNGNSVKDTDKISMTTGANDTTNMALTDIPEGDFEVLLKLKFAPTVENQQAGIILYQDDDTYVKFVRGYLWGINRFNIQHNNTAMSGTVGNLEVADTLTTDTCYLQLRKEGTTLNVWYGASEDNMVHIGSVQVSESFNPAQVGVFAASWGAAEIPAEVLDFRIGEVTTEEPGEDPEDKPVENPNSIFGYDWVFNGNSAKDTDKISMTTGPNDTTNMALTAIPEGDFDVFVKLKFAPGVENQQAGIILYQDDDTYVKFVRGYLWGINRFNIQHNNTAMSGTVGNLEVADTLTTDTCYLQLRKEGTTLNVWYGASEDNMVHIGSVQVSESFNPTQVGVFAASWGAAEIPAEVLDFRIGEVTTEEPGEDPGDKPVENPNSIFGYDWVFNGNSVKDTDKISMTTGPDDTTNMALTAIPEGDFDVFVKLKFAPGVENQQAGIILYQDDDTYVKFVRGYLWGINRFNIQHNNTAMSGTAGNLEVADTLTTDTCYLQLRKEGTTLNVWYGASEDNMVHIGSVQVSESFNPAQVGVFAASWGATEISAEVLDFVLVNASEEDNTNIEFVGGSFTETEDGYLLADTNGNNNVGSNVYVENFEYSADIKFESGSDSGYYFAAMIFGSSKGGEAVGSDSENEYYIAEITIHPGNLYLHVYNKENGTYSVVRAHTLITANPSTDTVYSLKVKVVDNMLSVECNDVMIVENVDLVDYTGGYLGLLSADSSVLFTNVSYKDLGEGAGGTEIDDMELIGANYMKTEDGAYNLQQLSYYNGMGIRRSLSAFEMSVDLQFNTPNAEGFYLTGLVFGADQSGANIMSATNNDCYVLEISMHPPQNTVYVQLYRLENGAFTQIMSHRALVSQGSVDDKYNLSLEITAMKEIVFKFNGEVININLGSHAFDELYTGGYVGVVTCVTEATFYDVQIVDNGEFDSSMLFQSNIDSWSGLADAWEYTSIGLTGSTNETTWALEEFAVDENEGFSFSSRVTLSDGSAGIAFGITNPSEPKDNSVLYTISESDGVNICLYNGTKQILYTRALTAAEAEKQSHVLEAVFEDGVFNFYLNGVVEFSTTISGYQGGYFGLAVENGTAGFNAVYIYKTKKPHLDSLIVTGAVLDKEYGADERSYYADVEYSVSQIGIRMEYDAEKYTAYLNGNAVVSGQEQSVELTAIGYNNISVLLCDNETGEEKTFYINVNRWPDMANAYDEDLRPLYHFTSVFSSYMNDPNGLIYNSYTGEYHLFYQYHAGIKHGYNDVENSTVSWGHAVSRDLVSWEELPLAITPDELGLNFSGSAVIDYYNVSGLFDGVPAESRMMIFYASAYGEDQSQGLLKISMAYSKDNGATWIKYDGNPVVKNPNNMYGGGLRDPSVFWYEDPSYEAGGIWVMLTVGNAHIFVSENLIDWEYSAAFTDINGTNIDFECPDVFQLPVDGDENNKKWVVTGGGVFYIIGHFERTGSGNGLRFVAETEAVKPVTPTYNLAENLVVTEHYATQTFSNMPDGRVVSISWLIDTTGLWSGKTWQGAQGIALENELCTIDGEVKLVKYPVAELDKLRGEILCEVTNTVVDAATENILSGVKTTVADINASIVFKGATKAGFIVRKGSDQEMVIYYDYLRQVLVVDKTNLDSRTSKGIIETEMHLLEGDRIELRILLDNICYDVFGNGEAAISGLLFSSIENDSIEFFADGQVLVENITIYSMNEMQREMDDQLEGPEQPEESEDPEEPEVQPSAIEWRENGETTYVDGVATVTNGGDENTENYLVANLAGNYTITAKVSGDHYLGMQLRTSSGYMFIRLNVAGKNYCSYGNLEGAGGVGDTAFEPTDDMYLRIVKNGNLFETYYSLDGGATWVKVYSYDSTNFSFNEYEIRLYSIGQPAIFSEITVEEILEK